MDCNYIEDTLYLQPIVIDSPTYMNVFVAK